MIRRSLLLTVLCGAWMPAHAQSLAGTWRAEAVGQPSWELFLHGDESDLRGHVNYCSTSGPRIIEIHDLNISGNSISFRCSSSDGRRTITLSGTISGDEITFTWKKEVRPNEFALAADPRFGDAAPARFTVRRVPDGELSRAFQAGVLGMEFVAAVNLVPENVKARGTLFVPQKAARVRAILVAIEFGLGGRLFEAPRWLKLAETLEGALLLLQVSRIGPSALNDLGTAMAGNVESVDTLRPLLQRLAQESGHQELIDAPLLFWGHSGGGHLATAFAGRFPERTLAFVRYHSASNLQGDLSVLSQVPAVFLAGGKDGQEIVDGAETAWRRGRARGAPWTFALNPEATHGNSNDLQTADQFLIPWISAVVRQRLPVSGDRPLRPVPAASGWVGNTATGEVMPVENLSGATAGLNWLPDEASAQGWRRVVRPAPLSERYFPAVPRDPEKPALGVWSGTVVDGPDAYGVEIQLQRLVPGEPAGKSLYHGQVNCGGSLRLLEQPAASLYVFTEMIDTPGSGCANGQIHLRVLDNERLHYEWRSGRPERPDAIPATATLDRKTVGR